MPPPLPPNKPSTPPAIPTLTLRIDDLNHPGVAIFFGNITDPSIALRNAVLASFTWLYTPETIPTNVQTILLILRAMPGVAHTTGSHADKEIHFSLDYITATHAAHPERIHEEILGVLTHEVVHCFQHNGQGCCPGGLIEGVADWVRLRADLAPPHWKPRPGEKWDAGYDATAFFLEWLEQRYGAGTVCEINGSMKGRKYQEVIFKEVTGRKVDKLWAIYCTDSGVAPPIKGQLGGGRKLWEDSVRYVFV